PEAPPSQGPHCPCPPALTHVSSAQMIGFGSGSWGAAIAAAVTYTWSTLPRGAYRSKRLRFVIFGVLRVSAAPWMCTKDLVALLALTSITRRCSGNRILTG